MSKIKEIIQYECKVAFRAVCVFYLIQYLAISLVCVIIAVSTGSFDKVGTNCLEINSIICVGIMGVFSFKDDFKMLIQNGFIRKQIFIATLSMFMFISGIMAFVDTVVANVLHHMVADYSSLFGSLYGYENILANWIWLFLVYMLICSLFYLAILVINRIGNLLSIYLGVIIGGVVLLIVALFRYVLSSDIVNNILELAVKALGFMTDGTINYIFPALTLILFVGILELGSYAIIRRTELK